MIKKKLLAPFLTLLAGAVISILMFIWDYDMKSTLIVLLCVLLFFYTLGSILQGLILKFEKTNEEKQLDEGEVIEKETPLEETEENSET